MDLPLQVPVHMLQQGQNRIVFVASDPEPHVLVAEIVVRLSAEQIKQEVIANRTLPLSVAKAHVHASFDRMGVQSDFGDDDEIEASSVQLTLHCPLTRMRLGIPARGVGCSHIEAFDLDAFLQVGTTSE